MFVSSTASNANLGGPTGADTRCQSLAIARGLGGTWMAWVSSSATSPSTRFTKSADPYRLLDGTLVATSYTSLVSGNIAHGIDLDEKMTATGGVEVWTATSTSGTYAGGGCTGFTSASTNAAYAAQGITDRKNKDWTNVYTQFCDRTNPRVYCFEQ